MTEEVRAHINALGRELLSDETWLNTSITWEKISIYQRDNDLTGNDRVEIWKESGLLAALLKKLELMEVEINAMRDALRKHGPTEG